MRTKNLLQISRPRFWIYLLGPFLVGLVANTSIANVSQALQNTNSSSVIILTLLGLYFTWPANLLIYGVNDIFDYETDVLNEKKQAYETLVRPNQRKDLWRAIVLSHVPFIIPIILASIERPWSLIGIIGFLCFGTGYSMPPIRAKTKPFLDSAFNILYIFPGIYAYLLLNDPTTLDWRLVIASSLWCMAMHAYSAVPDIDADRGAKIKTIATELGYRRTIWFCMSAYSLATIMSTHALNALSYILGICYVSLMVLSLRAQKQKTLFKYYTWFPKINTISGLALFFYALWK